MAIQKVPGASVVWATAKDLANKGQREGQAFFNALLQHQPSLAEEIRGSADDPFEVEDSDEVRRLAAKLSERIT